MFRSLAKFGLGYILGAFFTKASGHRGGYDQNDNIIKHVRRVGGLCLIPIRLGKNLQMRNYRKTSTHFFSKQATLVKVQKRPLESM
jgi:hypothetical protein